MCSMGDGFSVIIAEICNRKGLRGDVYRCEPRQLLLRTDTEVAHCYGAIHKHTNKRGQTIRLCKMNTIDILERPFGAYHRDFCVLT